MRCNPSAKNSHENLFQPRLQAGLGRGEVRLGGRVLGIGGRGCSGQPDRWNPWAPARPGAPSSTRSDHGPIRSLADQIIGEAAEVEVEPRMRPVVGEEFKTPIDRDVVVEVVIAQRVDRKAVSKVAVIVHHEVAVHVIDLKRSTDLDRFEPVQVPGSRSVSRQLSNKSEV